MPHHLRRIVTTALTAATAAACLGWSAPAQASTTHQHLSNELHKALKRSHAAHVDYSIHDSQLGNFGRNAQRSSAPASNQKLLTAITLLHYVGADFRYATPVAATAKPVNHVVHGSLVVTGSGDPTLTGYGLIAMAKHLHRLGVHKVTGHLVVDDTRYSHQTRVVGWKHNFVPSESGPMSAFTVDANAWRGGQAFDSDPTRYNARRLRHALSKHHIQISHNVEVRRAPPTVTTFFIRRSETLGSMLGVTLRQSVNFYAEMMLREAGAQYRGHGSPKTGVAAERAYADKLGLPLGVSHDGSGLSYADRETPKTLMRWLIALRGLPFFSTVFYDLPVSCESGTLEHRLCGPNVRGQVRAKTGTLTHISALSGYVTSKSGSHITFSFLADGVRDYTRLYKRVDGAVAVLRRDG